MNEFEQIMVFREFMKKNFPRNTVEFGESHIRRFIEYLENPPLSDEDYNFLECLDLSQFDAWLTIAKDCNNYIEITYDQENIILSCKCKRDLFQSLQVGKEYDLIELMKRYRKEKK